MTPLVRNHRQVVKNESDTRVTLQPHDLNHARSEEKKLRNRKGEMKEKAKENERKRKARTENVKLKSDVGKVEDMINFEVTVRKTKESETVLNRRAGSPET